MSELVILCVEDEPEVRDALVRDLAPLRDAARVDAAEDAIDARAAIDDALASGDRLALVLADHLLPGATGVELLVELAHDPATRPARKVLVTGQAGLEDTVVAVNEAGLDHYVAKPWDPGALVALCRRLLTDYVIEVVDDVLPFVRCLDGPRLLDVHRTRSGDR